MKPNFDTMMVTSSHLSVEQLKRFMLYEIKLTETAHDHLAHCSKCMNAMVSAVRDELLPRSSDTQPSQGFL